MEKKKKTKGVNNSTYFRTFEVKEAGEKESCSMMHSSIMSD